MSTRAKRERGPLDGPWWGVAAAAVYLLTMVGVYAETRRSGAEQEFDRWAARTGVVWTWRECADEAPLADRSVRCEVRLPALGRGVAYCPGRGSAETTCRWAR